jgi:hypothetical protein
MAAYDSVVDKRLTFRCASVAVTAVLFAGCVSVSPTPPSSGEASPTSVASQPSSASSAPTATPSPSVPPTFPLAVVTGLTNLKSTVTLHELTTLAERGRLVAPCGVEVRQPTVTRTARCRAADRIAAFLAKHQSRIALLPPGLVEPATKVLSIAGSGPFGLFGPDLFGDPKARAMDYPVIGSAAPGGSNALDPSWVAYDASEVWNMTSIGSLCASPAVAYQAVTLGKGWEWVFNGGTAKYPAPAVVDPPDDAPGPPYLVQPVATGNDGVTPRILKQSDVAIADHECPIMPNEGWTYNQGTSLVFSVPEAVLTQWRRKLGLDAAYLAANHMSDQGVAGIESTLRLLDKHHIPRTGLGMNLDEALKPAYVEVAGLKVAFVAWNDVSGVARAEADTPGVPWITRQNVNRAVRRARDGGADLVICDPQWWGGAEYHDDLYATQITQLGWFDRAGCDHVIGSGTHVAGPMLLGKRAGRPRLVLASPGNYMFGQYWWQEVQEGVILDMTFRGKELVNVRLHPYVMYLTARASLLDPEGDGHYVLQRIWQHSDVDY